MADWRAWVSAGVILPLLALGACPAPAAEVGCVARAATHVAARALYPSGRQPTENTCVAAWINGPIAAGDAGKLAALLRGSAPFLDTLYLNSAGGDAAEAMRVGAIVRHWRLATAAPFHRGRENDNELLAVVGETAFELCSGAAPGCGCAGACGFVWYAGARRDGQAPAGVPAAYVLRMGGEGRYPADIAAWLEGACGTYGAGAQRALLADVAQGTRSAPSAADQVRIAGEHDRIAGVLGCRRRMLANWRDGLAGE